MTSFISDAEASENEQVDMSRIHSQAMVLNKRRPAFLDRTSQAVIQDTRQMLELVAAEQQNSLATQPAFQHEIARLVDASLEVGLAQREFARALIASQGPLDQIAACYQDAERDLAGINVRNLEETYVRDRAQTVEVLAAGKRVVARSLAGRAELMTEAEESDEQALRLFGMGDGQRSKKMGGGVEDGLESIEKMVKKATKVIPRE